MNQGPGKRWLVGAVALFLLLFVLWVVAVFQLSPASAGAGTLQLRLRSNLAADYGAAPMLRMLRTLRLTVMEDVMRDRGMTDQQASAEMRAMAELLESPVPTATARSLMGEAPFTPTATRTPVPTDTPEPTATSTPRPRPTATETERPTKKPKTATPGPPTATSGPAADSDPPTASGSASVSISSCTADITIDATIYDAPMSSGISEVQVKYKVPGYVNSYTYLDNLGYCTGGIQGDGSWQGCYDGTVTFDEISSGWCGTVNPGPSDFTVEIYVKPIDNLGQHTYNLFTTFTLPHTCD
jgi:hypothetical protein